MTLQDFLQQYYCTFDIQTLDNVNLVITSQAKRRSENFVVDSVNSTMNIQETSSWIADSQTAIAINVWSWDKLLDQAKRFHLNCFVQRAPIDNYFPLNSEENPDISFMYS